MLASVRGTPYRRVERLFYEYIKAQRAEVERCSIGYRRSRTMQRTLKSK